MITANEEQLLAHTMTSFPSLRRILVIAPHPDDEVFGCGGTAALLRRQGVEVSTIVVTNGALGGANINGDVCKLRAEESRVAAAILGLDAPNFWKLPDRGVSYGEQLIDRLTNAIQETVADLVFLPSPTEWHPDHQTLAFAGAEAIRRLGGNRLAAFYEVTDALPCPNVIHDISPVADLKHEAMRCFHSQLSDQPYVDRITGINRFRAFHLGAQVVSAEAFHLVTAAELDQGLPRLLEGPLARRHALGFATSGGDLPLVSVIIRSMDRPTLEEALDSVALQTWPNIEVVLVNAKGPEHRLLPATWGRLPLRVVGGETSLQRSRAANLGLDAARGEYLMFLDDDDWFEADHVAKLVEALRRQPEFRVAYTDVRCVGENKEVLAKSFAFGFDAAKLLTGNFIPIHAALFSRHFLELGCRVDESLEVYEDWDFWLQLAKHGNFLHIEGTSALYRIAGQGGFGVNADQTATESARCKVYRKWLDRLGAHQIAGLTQIIHQHDLKDEQIASLNAAVALRDRHMTYLEGQVSAKESQIAALNAGVAESARHMAYLEGQVECRSAQIAELNKTLGHRDEAIANLDRLLGHLNGQVAMLGHAVTERDRHIANYVNSTSWRITKPMRLLSRLVRGQRPLVAGGLRARLLHHAKRIYWRLPLQYRTPLLHWGYRCLGPLFKGMPHYEQWKGSTTGAGAYLALGSQMLLIDDVTPAARAEGRIAIHLHLYYHDLATEFAQHLGNMPFAFDLYVSVTSDEGGEFCKRTFAGLARQGLLVIEKVPNRGRDIAPMFCAFGSRLKDYDYVAHLHGKKSLYNQGATEGWRQYLCENLVGNEERIRRIFTLMQGDAPRGIVYPQNFRLLPYQANTWLANRGLGAAWCSRLGITPVPQGYFDVPAGSMFWARGDALKPLFDAGITLDDFAEEDGQTDGTFAHCLERLLVLSARRQGYQPGIIQDTQHPRWSAWGFQQYASRPWQHMIDQLASPAIKLIAFDIFDTLLCRPLLDAESVKAIVAERVGGEAGRLYSQYRPIAEGQAREAAGKDIGMAEIFSRLGELTGLSEETLAQLRHMEEEVEWASIAPRTEAVELFGQALAVNKPVALISDMFLPRAVIERMLKDAGVNGWHRLFLSNEVGVRKDSGKLYEQVLSQYGIAPAEMLMIGDNERSDWQIPCDKGIVGMHLLKPVEFARGLPRLRPLVEANEGNESLNDELTLGLVLQRNFSGVCYPQLDPSSLVHPTPRNIGYSLIGPLLLGMAQWLLESARRDEIDRLYFLSREGQLIKQVYDVWAEGLDDTPQSHYLILSRRATSVPMIASLDDILNIARATYFPNTIASFLFERYGVQLNAERWSQIKDHLQWSSDSTVEVFNQEIDHLAPLLSALQTEILDRARTEYAALKHYLGTMGLEATGRQAVVDVGYGGTIQDYLNRLVATPVHGYYLITNKASAKVGQRHDVFLRGCYLENVEPGNAAPPMFLHSFELEKLLSSSDAQVVHYELDEKRNLTARHRELSDDETVCASFRAKLQEGVLQYARDARDIRERLFPAFQPSCAVADQLYEAFITRLSQQEMELLRQIALDDHYCGRGVVN